MTLITFTQAQQLYSAEKNLPAKRIVPNPTDDQGPDFQAANKELAVNTDSVDREPPVLRPEPRDVVEPTINTTITRTELSSVLSEEKPNKDSLREIYRNTQNELKRIETRLNKLQDFRQVLGTDIKTALKDLEAVFEQASSQPLSQDELEKLNQLFQVLTDKLQTAIDRNGGQEVLQNEDLEALRFQTVDELATNSDVGAVRGKIEAATDTLERVSGKVDSEISDAKYKITHGKKKLESLKYKADNFDKLFYDDVYTMLGKVLDAKPSEVRASFDSEKVQQAYRDIVRVAFNNHP